MVNVTYITFWFRIFMLPELKKKVSGNSFNTFLLFQWSKSGFFTQI